MTRRYTRYKYYALYNLDEELVMVGTSEECAEFLGLKYNSFMCRISNLKHGRIKGNTLNYHIYEIEEGDNGND